MGPEPLGWSALQAWSALRGVQLNPWELDTLFTLDRIALTTLQRNPAPASTSTTPPATP